VSWLSSSRCYPSVCSMLLSQSMWCGTARKEITLYSYVLDQRPPCLPPTLHAINMIKSTQAGTWIQPQQPQPLGSEQSFPILRKPQTSPCRLPFCQCGKSVRSVELSAARGHSSRSPPLHYQRERGPFADSGSAGLGFGWVGLWMNWISCTLLQGWASDATALARRWHLRCGCSR
jgi:hypothetical protein